MLFINDTTRFRGPRAQVTWLNGVKKIEIVQYTVHLNQERGQKFSVAHVMFTSTQSIVLKTSIKTIKWKNNVFFFRKTIYNLKGHLQIVFEV